MLLFISYRPPNQRMFEMVQQRPEIKGLKASGKRCFFPLAPISARRVRKIIQREPWSSNDHGVIHTLFSLGLRDRRFVLHRESAITTLSPYYHRTMLLLHHPITISVVYDCGIPQLFKLEVFPCMNSGTLKNACGFLINKLYPPENQHKT